LVERGLADRVEASDPLRYVATKKAKRMDREGRFAHLWPERAPRIKCPNCKSPNVQNHSIQYKRGDWRPSDENLICVECETIFNPETNEERRLSARVGACRSCAAPVYWGVTSSTGKRMPVDAQPRDNGNIVLDFDADPILITYVGKPTAQLSLEETQDRYVSHFATCPDRIAWRDRKPKAPEAKEPDG
jgi:hypothetical protein